MNLTINHLLRGGLVNYKQKVVIYIERDDSKSKMEYLKDQTEAIEKDYRVVYMEPKYCKDTNTAYLFIICE